MTIIASAILSVVIPATTNLNEQVSIMWAAHTNRIAQAEKRKADAEARKSAVDQVRENLKNHRRRSAFGKSAGGVK